MNYINKTFIIILIALIVSYLFAFVMNNVFDIHGIDWEKQEGLLTPVKNTFCNEQWECYKAK